MEMLNDSQNEMEFTDDARSTISPVSSISSISTSSIDTSSTCERKQKIESNIQVYTSVRQVTKRELTQNFSIHNDYEHAEYKSLKNSFRLFTKELKRLADSDLVGFFRLGPPASQSCPGSSFSKPHLRDILLTLICEPVHLWIFLGVFLPF
ncbi:hypothetical protein NPIL_663371 [Nephila pilipes]|uniref:Uncharacterized protein n=1 Tax=Nephila pilipes TaxID=299642 RepID=A0A8X6IQU9_NEPPI|nr:hypothetical protein NPIL_663371 [Nephila pilipes]